jgi:hypothetical protein
MFMVNYDDGRTAYLWIGDPVKANDTWSIGGIAQMLQEQGPAGKHQHQACPIAGTDQMRQTY